MKILYTGAPGSGTKCVSHYLKNLGIDCPHETLGEHGMVSSLEPFNGNSILYFEHTFLIYRHPLKTINSIQQILIDNPKIKEFYGLECTGLKSAIQIIHMAWFGIDHDYVLRVEDLPDFKIGSHRNTEGKHSFEPITLADCFAVDTMRMASILTQASKIGYEF